MIVRPYQSTDRAELNKLLEARGTAAGRLPKRGFVVTDGPEAAAFGFLRKVEGGYMLFDSLISNPKLNSEQRNMAMELLWTTVIAASKGKTLLGFTKDNGTLQRALKAGFAPEAYTVLVYKGPKA